MTSATMDVDARELRPLGLHVELGEPDSIPDEYPPHLMLQLGIAPDTVELLQALAGVGALERLGRAVEQAIAEAAADELDDLRGRADTLSAALQAAGPSPLRVPPTDPSPAPASSPPAPAALPAGARPGDANKAARRAAVDAQHTRTDVDERPERRPTPAPRPARRRAAAGPGVRPLRERLIATLADADEAQSSGDLQRACRASQPSTDKELRKLVAEGVVQRFGKPGRSRYELATGSAGAGAGGSGSASSAPPPDVRRPLGNGKTGKVGPRLSGGEGSTFAGRVLGALQLADMTPDTLAYRLGEPLPDVKTVLAELVDEDDVQRLPDGRFRAVL